MSGPSIEELLASRLGDRNCRFVFPSQAAADAWAGACARMPGVGAVETSRFAGWDRFKAELLSARRRERPADNIDRLLWASGVRSRQRTKPFLRVLLGPGAPSAAFVQFLSALPPGLKLVVEGAQALAPDSPARRDSLFADYAKLYEDYSAFLDAHDLFEPAWEELKAPGRAAPTLLIYPELIEDYARYARVIERAESGIELVRPGPKGEDRPPLARFPASGIELVRPGPKAEDRPPLARFPASGIELVRPGPKVEDRPPLARFPASGIELVRPGPKAEDRPPLARFPASGIELVRPGPKAEDRPPLARFPDYFQELRWVMRRAARLLDEGARPEDIAISVAGLEKVMPYLLRAARESGLPLEPRAGSMLGSTSFGRFLSAIAAAVSSGFTYEKMRELLSDRFLVWNQEHATLVTALLAFGLDHHACAPYEDGGRQIDIWEKTFAVCGAHESLARFYRGLRGELRAIAKAADFASLRSSLFRFRSIYLDESGWNESETRTLERIMVELEALSSREAQLGLAGKIEEPMRLLLGRLAESGYVQQSREPSIPVYPYRVSALFPVRHHFVLGCSQEGLRVRYAPASFLREDLKEALGLVDIDASSDFCAAYASRPGTLFSYAEEGPSGWTEPSPFFLLSPDRELRSAAPPENLEELLSSAPEEIENKAWSSFAAASCSTKARLLPFQIEAYRAALPSLAPRAPGFDKQGSGLSAKGLGLVLEKKMRGKLLSLQVTELEVYRRCPFAWLLAHGLGIEETASAMGFFDARLAGEMGHEAIRILLSSELPAEKKERVAAARAAVESALKAFETRQGPFLKPMFSAYAPTLIDRLSRLAEAECQTRGWPPGNFEAKREKTYEEYSTLLSGRLDRLSRRGGALSIVDYKKRRLPAKRDLLVAPEKIEDEVDRGQTPDAGPGFLGSLQIAAYVSLCENADLRVERASYWSIEEAKPLEVIGPDGLRSRDNYGAELAAFEAALAFVARGILAGRFSTAGAEQGEAGPCEGCPWKAVCRTRYATE